MDPVIIASIEDFRVDQAAFWIPLLIGLALSVVSYLLAPKPKKAQPPAAKPLEDPTAEAGKPIPVLFGTHIFRDPNILWYGQKKSNSYKVKA